MSPDPHPRIRRWLVVAFVAAVLMVGVYAADTPSAFLFALIPLAYTISVLVWLDWLEPEPRAMRWNAFLWGAGISVLVAGVANEVTTATVGSAAALVVSAPVVEEVMKTLGILGAAKRHHVDTPLDGAVYAGYVGIGFAMVENVVYFSQAAVDGDLGLVFALRGLFSPFAHPYFTVWAGLAIGTAVRNGRSRRVGAIRGILPAIALHASWNASALHVAFVALLLGHVALFLVLVHRLRRMRRDEVSRVRARLEQISLPAEVSDAELAAYGDLRATRVLRRKLSRSQRRAFDERRVMITKRALRDGV